MVPRGMIPPEQREWGLAAQARSRSPLSVVLISVGVIQRRELYQVLGELSGTPYIDLTAEPPDERMLEGLDPEQLVREGWTPVRALPDGQVLIAGTRRPRPDRLAAIERAMGHPVSYRITTDWDILHALQHGLRRVILDQAALGLWQRSAAQ